MNICVYVLITCLTFSVYCDKFALENYNNTRPV